MVTYSKCDSVALMPIISITMAFQSVNIVKLNRKRILVEVQYYK